MVQKKLAKSTKLAREYKKTMKKTKLGSGKRFAKLSETLEEKGTKSPKALAAWIGRKKYGKKKMTAIAIKGKKRASKK